MKKQTSMLVVVALALLTSSIMLAWPGRASAQDGPLQSRCEPTGTLPDLVPGPPAYKLRQPGEAVTPMTFEFGTERHVRHAEINTSLVSGLAPRRATVLVDVKIAGIRNRSITAVGVISDSGRELDVSVCIDPSQPGQIAPGEYTGYVRVDDPRFDEYRYPVVVRLQHKPFVTPLLFVLIAAFVGSLWQWIGSWNGLSPEEQELRKAASRFQRLSIARAELAFGALVGVGAAFTTVFLRTYLGDPAWNGSMVAHFDLALSAATAATSTYALVGLMNGFLRG